jgi:thiamine biosynthesis lipoprotein
MLAHNSTFDAIGTRWSIESAAPLSTKVQQEITSLIETFDATYSRFRTDSLVYKMAAEAAGEYVFPESIKQLYTFYYQLHEATDSRVTPVIGELLEDLGYDASYSLTEKATKRPVVNWNNAVRLVGTTLMTSQPLVLDIGAAGKGLLVDELSTLLQSHNYDSFTIDASGDIFVFGMTHEIVGLEDPRNTDQVIGKVRVQNNALCASANNRRRWGNGLHHIVDPISQKPVEDVLATWVLADTTMVADGLATALFFVDPNQLKHIATFSYARLFKDGSVEYSKDTNWEIYTA